MKQYLTFLAIVLLSLSAIANGHKNEDKTRELEIELKIFPNPVTNGIITLESRKHMIQSVHITNIAGVQIFSKKYPITEIKKKIKLNHVPNGIYLMKIGLDNGKFLTKKLVVSSK